MRYLIRLSIVVTMLLGSFEIKAQEVDQLKMSLFEVAENAIKEGDYKEAENALTNALSSSQSTPTDALLWSNLGVVRMNLGEDSLALEALNKAIELAPASVTIHLNRARLLQGMGRLQEALSDCDRAFEKDSLLIEPLYMRSQLRLALKDLEGARQDCRRMDLREPAALETHLAWGMTLKESGEFDKAIPHFSRVIERDPQAEYYGQRGACRLLLKRYTEASEDINIALEKDPANSYLYRLRALLYHLQYREEDAKNDMKKAIEIEKGHSN